MNQNQPVLPERINATSPQEMGLNRQERRKAQRGKKNSSYSKRLRAKITSDTHVRFVGKHNKAWDEVGTCSGMIYALLSMSVSLSPALKTKELIPHYPDASYVARVSITLATELTMLLRQYNVVKNKHKYKIGRANTIEEQLLSYQLYNDYMIILEKYNSSAAYLYDIVTEQIQAAINSYRATIGDEASSKFVEQLRASINKAISDLYVVRGEASKLKEA